MSVPSDPVTSCGLTAWSMTLATTDAATTVEPEPLWLDLPELRPWRWYVATILCFVVADR